MKPGATQNKLSNPQVIKLHGYLNNLAPASLTSAKNSSLAEDATRALGFPVVETNIAGMLRDVFELDKKTRTKPRSLGELEALILNLYEKLGQPLPT